MNSKDLMSDMIISLEQELENNQRIVRLLNESIEGLKSKIRHLHNVKAEAKV